MKKLVVFLVVAMMMLSLVGTAFAADFSDVNDLNKDAQASIAKLSILNVINGYPDGTFKPANTITRAEFAKIAVILGGLEKSADVLKDSPTKFKDVAASQWYTGWINLAESQGYVKGFPDGTFRPNAQITYAEVVTVLLRVLGYNDNLPGPWPVDYIAKAGALEITKNVTFTANTNATRVDVVVMSDAALDATTVKWNNDTESFDEQTDKNGKEITLLKKNFDTAINEDYLVTDVKSDNGVWSIKVSATDEDDKDLNGKTVELAENCVISDGSLPTGLGSAMVDIIYNSNDKKVLYLEITSAKVTADGEDWEKTKTDKDGYPTQYKIDGTKYDVADWADTNDLLDDFNGNDVYQAYINSDKDVYKVSKKSSATPAIVEEYDADAYKLYLKGAGTYKAYEDIEDIDFQDDNVLVVKGGKFIEAKDLQENDVIYVSEGDYGYDYYIEVTGGITAEGTLNAFQDADGGSPAQIKIDNTWYDVAVDTYLSTDDGKEFDDVINDDALNNSYDSTVKYFLNKANQVCIMISGANGTSSTTIYGAVTDLGFKYTKDGNKINEIEILNTSGKTATYSVDTSEVELLEGELTADSLIKFTVDESNKIDSLTILAYTDAGIVKNPYLLYSPGGNTNLKDYVSTKNNDYIGTLQDGDDDTNKIKFGGSWYKLTSSTVIFNGDAGDDEAQIESIDDMVDWAAANGKNTVAYVQYSGTTVDYIYVFGNVSDAAGGDYAAVLKTYKKSGDTWVDVDIKGTKESYKVTGSDPVKGSIYDYTITGSKFKVKGDAAFDPSGSFTYNDSETTVVAGTYAKVTDVSKANNAVKINGTWIYADEDTVLYNYSDWFKSKDDPKYYSSVSFISKGDYVVFYGEENGVDLLIKVNNIK